MKKRYLPLFIALVCLTVSAASALEVTDMLGRTVTVTSSERIVSLSPSGTEILFTLGAGDRVVGVSTYCDFPEEATLLPRCGDYWQPNLEAILDLEPTLIIAGDKLQADIVGALEALGFTVVAAEATGYADIAAGIQLIADAVGVDAKEALTAMSEREANILDVVADAPALTGYFSVSFYDWGDYAAGPGSFPYEMMEMIGIQPITQGIPVPWPLFTLEALIDADPDIIFLNCDAERAEVFFLTPGYMDLTAVKEGRVYLCDPNIASRPTPRILNVMAQMAQDAFGLSNLP